MNVKDFLKLLEDYKSSRIGQEEALERLKHLPYEDLGFARVDHHREMRKGFPEVVFGTGKTPDQILGIVRSMHRQDTNILITRSDQSVYELLRNEFSEAQFTLTARRFQSGRTQKKPVREKFW